MVEWTEFVSQIERDGYIWVTIAVHLDNGLVSYPEVRLEGFEPEPIHEEVETRYVSEEARNREEDFPF